MTKPMQEQHTTDPDVNGYDGPYTWLGTIAETMREDARSNDEFGGHYAWLLTQLSSYLLDMDRDHRSSPDGCKRGSCDSCDDLQGTMTDWPCSQWWAAFNLAMEWLIWSVPGAYQAGLRRPPRRNSAELAGTLPNSPELPDTRKREQAAERQRRKRERDAANAKAPGDA